MLMLLLIGVQLACGARVAAPGAATREPAVVSGRPPEAAAQHGAGGAVVREAPAEVLRWH